VYRPGERAGGTRHASRSSLGQTGGMLRMRYQLTKVRVKSSLSPMSSSRKPYRGSAVDPRPSQRSNDSGSLTNVLNSPSQRAPSSATAKKYQKRLTDVPTVHPNAGARIDAPPPPVAPLPAFAWTDLRVEKRDRGPDANGIGVAKGKHRSRSSRGLPWPAPNRLACGMRHFPRRRLICLLIARALQGVTIPSAHACHRTACDHFRRSVFGSFGIGHRVQTDRKLLWALPRVWRESEARSTFPMRAMMIQWRDGSQAPAPIESEPAVGCGRSDGFSGC
jgi:hypothetical protein